MRAGADNRGLHRRQTNNNMRRQKDKIRYRTDQKKWQETAGRHRPGYPGTIRKKGTPDSGIHAWTGEDSHKIRKQEDGHFPVV